MLVGIDHDGVCLADGGISAASGLLEPVCYQREVAPVGSVRMDAKAIALAQFQNPVQRVHGAYRRSPHGDHHRPHISLRSSVSSASRSMRPRRSAGMAAYSSLRTAEMR